MKNVLISGGTGLVGQALVKSLSEAGINVSILSRKATNQRSFSWNPALHQLDPKALEQVDTIIHLAGANVASHRWTDAFKKEIYHSRIDGLNTLFTYLSEHPHQVKTLISASATGIYPNGLKEPLAEDGPQGEGFLATTCKDWELIAQQFSTLGIRVACLRIGIVLTPSGGFIPRLAQPINYGFGATPGSGNQRISWIHLTDLLGMIIHIASHEALHGVYNAVADEAVPMKKILRDIATRLHRPLWLPPIPAWALRLIFGEFTEELLADKYVSNQRIKEAGFEFQFPRWEIAVNNLMP